MAFKKKRNRQLTDHERASLFLPLWDLLQKKLESSVGGDTDLLWALRRKFAKELTYLERSKPAKRKRLKKSKRREQNGLCAECNQRLPEKGAVLDRRNAMFGYTPENTKLICPGCDAEIQRNRNYT